MPVDFRICFVTDRAAARGRDIVEIVARALEGGVGAVQLREKEMPGRPLLELAEALRRVTAEAGAKLLVNDRADVALAAGADGVHLGTASYGPAAARRLLGPTALVGCSTHSLRELREVQEGGADFVTFGPVFDTPSKRRYGPPLGLAALAEACRTATVPVFAIGGVGVRNAGDVLRAGARGIALISEIAAADNPAEAARSLREAVERWVEA